MIAGVASFKQHLKFVCIAFILLDMIGRWYPVYMSHLSHSRWSPYPSTSLPAAIAFASSSLFSFALFFIGFSFWRWCLAHTIGIDLIYRDVWWPDRGVFTHQWGAILFSFCSLPFFSFPSGLFPLPCLSLFWFLVLLVPFYSFLSLGLYCI